MHIDPFSTTVFTILITFMMSMGLFVVACNYLREIKGICYWATALLSGGVGWLLLALNGRIPNFFSLVIGTVFCLLGAVFYFQALANFRERRVSMFWLYVVLMIAFIGNYYFIEIHFNMAAKIAVTSTAATILLFANSLLLLPKQHGFSSHTHYLTGSFFALSACIYLVRAIYYSVWNTQAEQAFFNVNLMQDLTYITNPILYVGTSFGFALMCIEKYLAEKHRAQFAQQEISDRLQKIANQIRGVVYQFKMTTEGQFSVPYCSAGVYYTFKLSPQQVYKDVQTIFNRIHPDDYGYFMDSIRQSAQQLSYWVCEFRVRFEDGTVRWLMGNSNPQRDADGSTVWHGFITDITERHEDKQQLQILSVAIEQSPAAIMILDTDFNLLYVNPKFSEITGYQTEEVLGKIPRILHTSLNTAETYQQLWDTLSQGQIWHGELMNYRKNGELYWDEVHIAPVKNSQGGIKNYLGIKLDITKRKQAELELQHTKEAAIAANQAKSEFLANMSHEIRTPMNAVLGFSDILTDLVTDSTQRYYLNAIKSSGKTLLQLINDILDLSKIEAGKMELRYSKVSIKSICNDVEIIFKQKLSDNNIRFIVEVAENLPDCLILDEIRLRQVLLNIVSNATKFTHQGFVRISVACKSDLSDFKNKEGLVDVIINIEDSGIGIPAEQVDSIFESFTQQKNQSVQYGGTGLGLTICKKLIEMMGGTISVRSQVGKGSCFTIELPQVEICNQTELKRLEEKQQLSKSFHFQPARLLLVDDVESNRLLIKAYLYNYPELQIIEAANGKEALSLTSTQHFNLIFMDRRLPDMDGDSVCEKIRAIPEKAAIPIIMISASIIKPEELPVFYQLQLNKPVNKPELLNAMATFLPQTEIESPTPEGTEVELTQSVTEETINPELLAVLVADYQETINKLILSGGYEISTIIEVAEQLLKIANQYHCQPLVDWASTLKNQAQLFDIHHLSKTLQGFEALLAQLCYKI